MHLALNIINASKQSSNPYSLPVQIFGPDIIIDLGIFFVKEDFKKHNLLFLTYVQYLQADIIEHASWHFSALNCEVC